MSDCFNSLVAEPPRHTAGSPCPVYVGGILYRSIFEASIESGISSVWMLNCLKASKGAPVVIRGTAVVERDWVKNTVTSFMKKIGGTN